MTANAPPGDASRRGATWIVCLRTTRDVDDRGMVRCPFAGVVELQACGECRFLEDLEADRRFAPCTTGET